MYEHAEILKVLRNGWPGSRNVKGACRSLLRLLEHPYLPYIGKNKIIYKNTIFQIVPYMADMDVLIGPKEAHKLP